MATDMRDDTEFVIVDSDEDVAVIGEVPVNNGTLKVKVDSDDTYADYSCGPCVGLALDYEGSEGIMVSLNYLDIEEEDVEALIAALTKALAIERARARDRGYYDWVEAGRPVHD